jgi:uncharacterized protein YqhQ
MKSLKVSILDFYPILTGAMNVVLLCGLLCFIILKGWRNITLFRKGLLLAIIVWLLNAGFTIFASSAALRFQSFPILLVTVFALLLIDWIYLVGMSVNKKDHFKLDIHEKESIWVYEQVREIEPTNKL